MALLILAAGTLQSATVAVSGSGKVGISKITADNVDLGLTLNEYKALVLATGQELIERLTIIIYRLNARLDVNSQRDRVSLDAAQSLLRIIRESKVTLNEWPEVFGELIRQYRLLGVQITPPRTANDKLKRLLGRVDAARKTGQFHDADRLLVEAVEVASQYAQSAQPASEPNRQRANLIAARATLAFIRLEMAQGATLLENAFESRKGDFSNETLWWLFEAGDAWLAEGQYQAALRTYEIAQDAARSMLTADPKNTQSQRDFSISHDKIGDVLAAQGDNAAALKRYQAGLAIAERLAANNPRNTQRQHDLSVSYDTIGDLESARGNSAAALKSYQDGLAIHERLAMADPRNIQRQRDLASSYVNVGNAHGAMGDRIAALQYYQIALAIRQRWSTNAPHDSQWKSDLATSHNKVGDVQTARGESAAAIKSYQSALAIHEQRLTGEPQGAALRRELSISHNKVGDVQAAQGDSAAALKSYQASLAFHEALTVDDPGNTELLRDLSVSYNKIGDIQAAQADSVTALKNYRAGLAIRERLAASDPNNSQWQRDLAVSYRNLARLGAIGGSVDARRALMQKGLDILVQQLSRNQLPQSNVGWIKLFQDGIQALK